MAFRRIRILLLSALLALEVGCQLKPTKVFENSTSSASPWNLLVDKTAAPVHITGQTVVLDARSEFDYGLAHVKNSIHFRWDKLAETSRSGALLADANEAAQRLALLGIQPDTPVVVIGYGPKGRGEAGRVAFSLLYYGLKDVQVLSIDSVDVHIPEQTAKIHPNVAVWTPEVRKNLVISKHDFIRAAMSPRQNKEGETYILDVRSKKEYFSKVTPAGPYKVPDLQTIHIDWQEFFKEDGRPDPSIKERLQGIGVDPSDRVIVISNQGIRSAAVVYALLAIGYRHPQNYVGGWNELLSK